MKVKSWVWWQQINSTLIAAKLHLHHLHLFNKQHPICFLWRRSSLISSYKIHLQTVSQTCRHSTYTICKMYKETGTYSISYKYKKTLTKYTHKRQNISYIKNNRNKRGLRENKYVSKYIKISFYAASDQFQSFNCSLLFMLLWYNVKQTEDHSCFYEIFQLISCKLFQNIISASVFKKKKKLYF